MTLSVIINYKKLSEILFPVGEWTNDDGLNDLGAYAPILDLMKS